jgi:transcription termination factor Rho
VTDTTEIAAAAPASSGTVDLSTLRLPQLQAVASQLGISGTGRMRKSELLEAIQTKQNGGSPAAAAAAAPARTSRRAAAPAGAPTRTRAPRVTTAAAATETPVELPAQASPVETASAPAAPVSAPPVEATQTTIEHALPAVVTPDRSESTPSTETAAANGAGDAPTIEREPRTRSRNRDGQNRDGQNRDGQNRDGQAREGQARDGQAREGQSREGQARDGQARDAQARDGQARDGQNRDGQNRNNNQARNNQARDGQARNDQGRTDQPRNDQDDDEDGDARGRRRRGRFRDRKRRPRDGEPGGAPMADEPEVSEDDVVLPVAGILDVLDSYAFLRTSGYLPGPNDVYVSLGQVKKYGLRKGDAVTGAVRQPREGEQQQNQRAKFNALVRMDTVNGAAPDDARGRVEFGKLTPLYPQERLRLETEANGISNADHRPRRADRQGPARPDRLAAEGRQDADPAGDRERDLGNNPECHLMVVLVDERPEEVTDMQRTVKGEVIASTFDRPAEDHTTVAELAIERAEAARRAGPRRRRPARLDHPPRPRLQPGRAGQRPDPVRWCRLQRAVPAEALLRRRPQHRERRLADHPGHRPWSRPARKMDEVIFEEFKGTGNMELRLSRQLADKRIFPAVDVNASSTRPEEILMGKDELSVI